MSSNNSKESSSRAAKEKYAQRQGKSIDGNLCFAILTITSVRLVQDKNKQNVFTYKEL